MTSHTSMPVPTKPYDGGRGEIILAQDPNRVLWQIGGIKGGPTKSWMLTDYSGRIIDGPETTGVFTRKYDAWLAWKQSELASSSQVSYATHLLAQAVKKGTMKASDVPSKADLQAMTSKDIGGLISGLVEERGTPTWYGNGSFGGFKASAARVAARYMTAAKPWNDENRLLVLEAIGTYGKEYTIPDRLGGLLKVKSPLKPWDAAMALGLGGYEVKNNIEEMVKDGYDVFGKQGESTWERYQRTGVVEPVDKAIATKWGPGDFGSKSRLVYPSG
jgi:hypothetical protein